MGRRRLCVVVPKQFASISQNAQRNYTCLSCLQETDLESTLVQQSRKLHALKSAKTQTYVQNRTCTAHGWWLIRRPGKCCRWHRLRSDDHLPNSSCGLSDRSKHKNAIALKLFHPLISMPHDQMAKFDSSLKFRKVGYSRWHAFYMHANHWTFVHILWYLPAFANCRL